MSEHEDIAKTMHEAYERLAPEFGYTTRSESAVPWEMVPKNSRALMVAAVTEAVSPLLTRVAELEAENRHLAIDLACWKHSGAVTFDRAEQAEAELAERDEALRSACRKWAMCCDSLVLCKPCIPNAGKGYRQVVREARAEEGSGA